MLEFNSLSQFVVRSWSGRGGYPHHFLWTFYCEKK